MRFTYEGDVLVYEAAFASTDEQLAIEGQMLETIQRNSTRFFGRPMLAWLIKECTTLGDRRAPSELGRIQALGFLSELVEDGTLELRGEVVRIAIPEFPY